MLNQTTALLISYIFLLLCINSCIYKDGQDIEKEDSEILRPYQVEAKAQVMVLGVYHFAQETDVDELSPENQQEIDKILRALAKFRPTKVVIEKEARFSDHYNKAYQEYRAGTFSIDTLPNETYQLGFKLADRMNHDSIYLFDNKPDFIGSLDGFTFSGFNEYAVQHDSAFTQKHINQIVSNFAYNDSVLKSLPLFEQVKMMNSPKAQVINTNRMHMYEVRVGIDENWIGADWLGRWYQRNIRMMGHLLKVSDSGDRLLVVVGDNHKWVLEDLMNRTPDLEVVSAFEYLN